MIETEDTTTITTCQGPGCLNTIKQVGGRGHRPKVFCSDRCRQQHHRAEEQRQRWETMAAIEADAQARITALEKTIKELQERLNIEERFRTDIEVRHFKSWLRRNPQARDTDFFKRFLLDTRLPQHGSRSWYAARLHQYGYSAEEIALFEEAWKDMLFQS